MRDTALAFVLLTPVALTLCGCAELEQSLEQAAAESSSSASQPVNGAPYGLPLTAVNGQGTVVVKEGSATVAVCKTASANIEQTRFINEQNQIVVKSRGNHGPATVELFNARTGRLEGTVKAYELQQGGPKWAAGMAD